MLIPGAFPQVPRPQHNPPRTWPYPVPAAIQNTATSNLLHQANNKTTKLSSEEECEWFDVLTFRCTETEPMTGSMRQSGNWWQWLEPHHPIFSGSLSWLSTLDFYSPKSRDPARVKMWIECFLVLFGNDTHASLQHWPHGRPCTRWRARSQLPYEPGN